jgi:glycosyltransferase involved in cell wall biosynthesis
MTKTPRMKILYITLENLSFHKGSVVHVKEVVNGLRKLGNHVGLVANSLNQDEKAPHFYNLSIMPPTMLRLLRLKKQPYVASLVFLFFYLWRILPQYSIIYARDFHTVIIALLPRLIFKKKLVFEVNGIANEERRLRKDSLLNHALVLFIKWAEKLATRYSEKVIAVAPKIKLYLTQNFNCPSGKIQVISNGVNTEVFCPIHESPFLVQWKNRLGIKPKDTIIAYVGNLAPWQGIGNLIDIAFRLLSKNKELKFIIAGEGPLKSLLLKKVLNSEYDGDIIFTGMLDHEEIPFIINLADICVAPLKVVTGSPIKVFEYMACGKPVITSEIEGLEFIEAEGVGRLTASEDIVGLEEALNELINDPRKRADMGQKGRQIARERFSWESRITEIEELLRKLV